MKQKLIIFDCDGVLVDSEYIASRVFAEALNPYGYKISAEESIRKFTGVSEKCAREIILEESQIDLPDNYWSQQHTKLHAAYKTELNPLMQPFLEILNLLKLPRCVASNSSMSHVVNCLKICRQDNYFDDRAIFTSQRVSKPKPAPDLFLLAADQMGFEPKDCIVIEDSHAGTQAAIAAGMEVFIFLGGSHARYEWYRSNLAIYNKPLVASCQELFEALCPTLISNDHLAF